MRIVSLLGACLAAGTSVAAADPLNVYVGAGLGYSTVQQSFLPAAVEEHPTGWKLFAGWRPIQMFGAEIEYVDLGSRSSTYITDSSINYEHASASAVAAFAVGYLPQPVPFLDFYGKLGVASLHTKISNTVNTYPESCGLGCMSVFGEDASRARFAYAAGVQLKFGVPALRLEYQGFSISGEDQSLLSLDLAVNF